MIRRGEGGGAGLGGPSWSRLMPIGRDKSGPYALGIALLGSKMWVMASHQWGREHLRSPDPGHSGP